ncbi:MAG: hypothetical protein ACRCT8_16390 [Lacipirellulaceae bacterium]
MLRSVAAFAAALALCASTGCTAMRSCGPGGAPCHVTQSQMAPRASGLEGRCMRGPGFFDKMGWTQVGCGDAVGCHGYGCEDGSCGPGGCGPGGCGALGGGGYGACGAGQNCVNNAVGAVLDCNQCDSNYNFAPGPPTGQVAYPYYTVRGPRDFLMCNPPSIGPR